MKARLFISGFVVMVLLLTQACTRSLDPEEPCNFVQSTQLQRVSWKEDLPVKMMVHASVPQEFWPSIEAAVQHWNTEMNKRGVEGPSFVIELWGVGGPIAPNQDFNNMIYWMENDWEPNLANQQARTTIYWTGSRIYEADIRINDKNHDFYTQKDPEVEDESEYDLKVDFQSLMVHEFGHVLGLAHNSSESSVMQVELASGVERRNLGEIDMKSVSCEYH